LSTTHTPGHPEKEEFMSSEQAKIDDPVESTVGNPDVTETKPTEAEDTKVAQPEDGAVILDRPG
jgi:hypothetical protein